MHNTTFVILNTTFGRDAWEPALAQPVTTADPDIRPSVHSTWAIGLVHVYKSAKDDPFADRAQVKRPSRDTKVTQAARDVAALFAHQHRACVFTILIAGRWARIVRWDRAGAVASKPFKCADDPVPLLRFMRWLAAADRAQQGFDTSVCLADEAQVVRLEAYKAKVMQQRDRAQEVCQVSVEGEDIDGMRAEAEYRRHVAEFVLEITEDASRYPIYQVWECPLLRWLTPFIDSKYPQLQFEVLDLENRVTRDDSLVRSAKHQTLTLLIGKPRVQPDSLTGRGTKGYAAYVLGEELEERLVFVKMGWRRDCDTPELDRYKALYQNDVKYIAQVLGGGDVYHDLSLSPTACDTKGNASRLSTRSQEFFSDRNGASVAHQRVQHSLIIETLWTPVNEYSNASAMVHAVSQAVSGAYFNRMCRGFSLTVATVTPCFTASTRVDPTRHIAQGHQRWQHPYRYTLRKLREVHRLSEQSRSGRVHGCAWRPHSAYSIGGCLVESWSCAGRNSYTNIPPENVAVHVCASPSVPWEAR